MIAVAEPTIVDLGFAPRQWQEACFRGFKSRSVVVVHRRGGKTVMAIMRLVDAALRCERERGRYGYIAPLLKQAKGIAWDYLKAYARKVPSTIINEGELWVEFPNHARIRIYGADNPDSLRGLYFDGVVIDEVAQTKPDLWKQVIMPTLKDRDGWALFIGTPKGINIFSELYYAAAKKPDWFAASFNCHQTDAFTPAQLESERADLNNETIWRQEWLCDFAASSDNTLITIDTVLAAAGRNLLHHRHYEYAPKILGVDVAWQGGDRSAMYPRQGLQAFRPKVYHGLPEKALAIEIAKSIDKWKPDAVFVDNTGGYGGEVVSRLRENGYRVQEVVFSWKSHDPRYANLRAEMWWKMAAWLRDGGALCDNEHLTQLQLELCAPTYSNDNAANRLQLESKDDIRKRLEVSPDLADALALTFAFPVFKEDPVTAVLMGGSAHHAKIEFNPYADGEA